MPRGFFKLWWLMVAVAVSGLLTGAGVLEWRHYQWEHAPIGPDWEFYPVTTKRMYCLEEGWLYVHMGDVRKGINPPRMRWVAARKTPGPRAAAPAPRTVVFPREIHVAPGKLIRRENKGVQP